MQKYKTVAFEIISKWYDDIWSLYLSILFVLLYFKNVINTLLLCWNRKIGSLSQAATSISNETARPRRERDLVLVAL
jgi:hypothetical protein